MQTQRTGANAPRIPRTDLERAAMEEPLRQLAKVARLASHRMDAGEDEPTFRATPIRRVVQVAHDEMRAGTLTEWPPEIATPVRDAMMAKLSGRAGCSPATRTEIRLLAGLLAA